MIVYFIVIACVGGLFTVRNSNLAQTQRAKDTYYWLVWLLLLAIVALRYNVGTDYKLYRSNYNNKYASAFSQIGKTDASIGADVVAVISKIVYDDYATWFAIMAILAILPCAWLIRKECSSPCISTVLFIVLGCWHTSFNIVMQCASIGILAIGYRFLRDRCLWRWCILCVLASVFHITALIMIPVYFLASPQITWRRVLFLIVVGLVITVTYDELFALMARLSGDSMTETVNSSFGSNRLNIFRVLVNCAPAIMATLMLKHYNVRDKQFCMLYNMSLFNAVLNVGTMNSAYLNRFALYSIFYNALFIPYLVKPFKRNTRIFVWTAMILLYVVFWAYDLYKVPDTRNFYWIFERGV